MSLQTEHERRENWKGSELKYCRGLIHTRGDKNVSSKNIAGYLAVQEAAARQDCEGIIALMFERSLKWLREGFWQQAEAMLR